MRKNNITLNVIQFSMKTKINIKKGFVNCFKTGRRGDGVILVVEFND